MEKKKSQRWKKKCQQEKLTYKKVKIKIKKAQISSFGSKNTGKNIDGMLKFF
jgi:hypothetical protein